ncbi:MAG: hypothetical protein LOX98_00580 [Lysobacter sp.]|nr:hypothetical protein [Lysobacter sp.]
MHRVAAALAVEDVDHAIEAGLLDCEPCPDCTPHCQVSVIRARDERRFALAARERFRAREARLQRLAAERDARRAARPRPAAPDTSATEPARPALPAAAAAALARARARAAGTRTS